MDEKSYKPIIRPTIDDDKIISFNANILSGEDKMEYLRYKDISEGAREAADSIEDYLAQCLKLQKEAKKEDYLEFVNEKLADNTKSWNGMTYTL